jgi:hypothetical protein
MSFSTIFASSLKNESNVDVVWKGALLNLSPHGGKIREAGAGAEARAAAAAVGAGAAAEAKDSGERH